MLNWAYFPRSAKPTALALDVVRAFEAAHPLIASHQGLKSDGVLAHVAPHLAAAGFKVETGKKKTENVRVPVLYGNNGKVAKAFDADAYHVEGKFVVEVEAGRGVRNNQFLKDFFQACMMDEIAYLAIAVCNVYKSADTKYADFDNVVKFFDTLYASRRLELPLRGVLIIGY